MGVLKQYFWIFWKFDITGLSKAGYWLIKRLAKSSRGNLFLNLIEKSPHYHAYISDAFYSALTILLTQ